MTATSKERIEVAELLRIEVKDEDTSLDYPVCRIINDVLGVNGAWGDKAARILADLVDPTCTVKLEHVVVDDYRRNTLILPVCSACGFTFDKRMPKPNFCPECGARLVSDDG